ncbi:MAG: ankyrin repeat domain-containing protein [Puniceicoccaceae bacterium]
MYRFTRSLLLVAVVASAYPLSAGLPDRTLADLVEKAEFEKAIQLIESGHDVNASQPDGTTPLIWAAYHANSSLVELLLKNGADPVAKNRYNISGLAVACGNGDAMSASLLLDAGADPKDSIGEGETMLMLAARSGNPDLVEKLLQLGTDVNREIPGGQTALMFAAAEGSAETVSLLLEAGADPLAKSRHGFTSIHFAARAGHNEVIRLLVKSGVDVDLAIQWTGPGGFRSPRNRSSPLIFALENAEFEAAVMLLELGADPNDMRTGYAPLHTMTWVRKAHLGDSADPEPVVHGRMSRRDMLLQLIESGADVNQRVPNGRTTRGKVTEKGCTPFFMAADRGDLEMMQLLVEHGADPHIPNEDGVTPLMIATGLGRGPENDEAGTQEDALAAVAYCIELGMDVNTVDANGETAMHGAAYGQWPQMVRLLHENGADISVWNRLNKWKWSPLLIAQGYRQGNFKPSYDTIEAIEAIMAEQGVTLRFDPPADQLGYDD